MDKYVSFKFHAIGMDNWDIVVKYPWMDLVGKFNISVPTIEVPTKARRRSSNIII